MQSAYLAWAVHHEPCLLRGQEGRRARVLACWWGHPAHLSMHTVVCYASTSKTRLSATLRWHSACKGERQYGSLGGATAHLVSQPRLP